MDADSIGQSYNPFKMFTGSFIPEWLECRTEISPGAKLVFARMCRYSGRNGQCNPRQKILSKAIGLSERQTRTYIKELEIYEVIKNTRLGLGKSNTYKFLIHKWMFADQERQDASDQERQETSDQDRQDAADHYNIGIGRESFEENQLKENVAPKSSMAIPEEPKSEKSVNDHQLLVGVLAKTNGANYIQALQKSSGENSGAAAAVWENKIDVPAPMPVQDIARFQNSSKTAYNGQGAIKIIPTDVSDEDLQKLLFFWNSLDIIKHTVAPKNGRMTYKTAVSARIKEGYTLRQMCLAMQTYAQIVKSEEYWFKYKWNVTEFLVRGLEKFIDGVVAKENYRHREIKSNGQSYMPAPYHQMI